MRPMPALEATLAEPEFDYARNETREPFVDDLTDTGDTLLLAAIRRGDTDEALMLIDHVRTSDYPRGMRADEIDAYLGRRSRRADPFLRGADGVSPIQLAHRLGHDEVAEALIQSAIAVHKISSRRRSREIRFSSRLVDTLMSNQNGFKRFDDGDTPLHRAVRTNNERAVLTMLRLTEMQDSKRPYEPAVDLYAYDASGESALSIARREGFYASERFLLLAMAQKSPGWAVSRAAFTTHMKSDEPGDCREVAFEDEESLSFFAELSDMDGRRIAHEWSFDREPVERIEFVVEGDRWSAHSRRDFSPADVGAWDVRVVTDAGEVLHSERLHYRELTDYNRKNRHKMLGSCNVGAKAFYALVKAQAPIAELEYLLDKGTTLKLKSNMGKDLVSQAIVDGNIRLVGWFLERGLDIEAYVNGAETPLLLAVQNGQTAMALYLITRGAEIDFKRNRDGQTALQLAVSEGNVELARMLLEQGADPNSATRRGFTALDSAVRRCDGPTAGVLLEHGADPDFANAKGKTPRDRAAKCSRQESWDASLLVSDARS